MARTNAVWGLDIGQCAMKALRCQPHEDPSKVIVDAFDYIEYPKILSQPDVEPAEMIAEALTQFLSRNSVKNDRVAVSVSGQSGLARFIKLPPVEAKKIPDIVRYEAKQQIPFDLNDVIWDYQRMGGGAEEEGFALETEIGLFAMKREAVFRALEPFQQAGIEVDYVQLTPLAIYNYMLFDQIKDVPPPDEYDPDNPPESVVVISLGTDATDLVVTNGYRVWQRSVPLGGSHFTKALTKELKLTFAKAEHLKRNATTAQDPKAVFQAMRPVFNDMQTELQRSLGFFANLDRHAKIGRVVALGNAFKLPGLRRYLAQGLGFEIERVDCFHSMVGAEVLANPAFKDNILSFAVCYGLALQGLTKGGLRTNLLPKEIVKDRLIREKKPWAVAAAAAVLLGLTVSYASFSMALGTVKEPLWSGAESEANSVISRSGNLKSEATKAEEDFKATKQIGEHLVSNVEGRTRWLELLQVVAQCLPQNDPDVLKKPIPKDLSERQMLNVTNIDCKPTEEVTAWWEGAQKWYQPPSGAALVAGGGAAAPALPTPGEPAPAAGETPAIEGPKGPGVIIQLMGHHYHNEGSLQGAEYVRQTLVKKLETAVIHLPPPGGDIPIKEYGISYPVLVSSGRIFVETIESASPTRGGDAGAGAFAGIGAGAAAVEGRTDTLKLQRFNFRVQFCWKFIDSGERQKVAPAETDAAQP